jgi:hypothetical protein
MFGNGSHYFTGVTFLTLPIFAGADNGTSVDSVSGDVVLGQHLGEAGDPAKLLDNRHIPFNGFTIFMIDIPGFDGLSFSAGRIGVTGDLQGEVFINNLNGTFSNQCDIVVLDTGVRFDFGAGILFWDQVTNLLTYNDVFAPKALNTSSTPIPAGTAVHTFGLTESVLLCDTSTGNLQVNVDPVAMFKFGTGRHGYIKKIGADANTITIVPTSGTIEGAASYSFNGARADVHFFSDGTNLYIL